MCRQVQPAVAQQLGPVNDRMHQQILPFAHPAHVAPCKNLACHKRGRIFHDFFTFCALLLVDKIRDQKVQRLIGTRNLPQRIQNLFISIGIHPVIAVHNLEKQPVCMCNPCIYRFAVPAVFLMDCFYNVRISFRICIRNFGCHILRSVVHHQNLHILPAGQQRLYTTLHIVLGIVTWYCNR